MSGVPPWLVGNLFKLHLTRYAAFFTHSHAPEVTITQGYNEVLLEEKG